MDIYFCSLKRTTAKVKRLGIKAGTPPGTPQRRMSLIISDKKLNAMIQHAKTGTQDRPPRTRANNSFNFTLISRLARQPSRLLEELASQGIPNMP
jgi:hypothetical protein